MSYYSIIQKLPDEWRPALGELADAIEKNLREQLAVRREDFDGLKTAVQELAQAQARTDERLQELAQALTRLEEIVAQQALSINELTTTMIELTKIQTRMGNRQDQLVGYFLERKYREHAPAFFGRILRKVRVVSFQEIEDELEAKLPDYERNDLLLLDLLVRGAPRAHTGIPEVWVAVEVSNVVDNDDVERAQRRAAILQRLGYPIIPAVAGEGVTGGGEEATRTGWVLLLQNGNIQFLDEALARHS